MKHHEESGSVEAKDPFIFGPPDPAELPPKSSQNLILKKAGVKC